MPPGAHHLHIPFPYRFWAWPMRLNLDHLASLMQAEASQARHFGILPLGTVRPPCHGEAHASLMKRPREGELRLQMYNLWEVIGTIPAEAPDMVEQR